MSEGVSKKEKDKIKSLNQKVSHTRYHADQGSLVLWLPLKERKGSVEKKGINMSQYCMRSLYIKSHLFLTVKLWENFYYLDSVSGAQAFGG